MERLTRENFILRPIIKEIGKTEEGYIYIIDELNDKYELNHGTIYNRYLIYIKQGENIKIIEHKKDLKMIKDFIEGIEV